MRVQAWLSITAMVGAFAAAAVYQVGATRSTPVGAEPGVAVVPVRSIADLSGPASDMPRGVGARGGCVAVATSDCAILDAVLGADVAACGCPAVDAGDALTAADDQSLRSGSASDVLTRNSSDDSEDASRFARRGR